MKEKFSIKKFNIILFTFLCMFFTVKNVEAEEKYVCDYEKGYNSAWSFYDNLNIRIIYDNGNYSMVYFDDSGKTYTSSEVYENGMWINDDSLTNIKSWDYKKNGCPNLYYSRSNGDNKYLSEGDSITYYIDKTMIYGYEDHNNSSSCINTYQCGYCSKLSTSNDIDTSSSDKCSYAPTSDAGITNFVNLLEFSLNDMSFTRKEGKFETFSIEIAFNKADIKNACPKNIYIKYIEGRANSLVLEKSKSKTENAYYEELGLLTTLQKGEAEKKEFDGCKSMGTLDNILSTLYKLIRYLVPLLIIILSIIDFVGVTLSGDNEKMEKAKKKFTIRLVIGIIVLLVPSLLELILRIAGVLEKGSDLSDIACNIF